MAEEISTEVAQEELLICKEEASGVTEEAIEICHQEEPIEVEIEICLEEPTEVKIEI